MYIALAILICGIIAGKLLQKVLPAKILQYGVLCSILLLLFLLGASIGANSQLLDRLSTLGLDALIIMLLCVAGSLLAQAIVMRIPAFRKAFFAGRANAATHAQIVGKNKKP